jgi:hypothetical protein
MQNRPLIRTAIPKRRYRVGRYFVTLLGDIESSDERCYRYILAFVLDGQSDPVVYVCAEVTPPPQQADGAYQLRVMTEKRAEVVNIADRWGDLEIFATQALNLGMQLLRLQQALIERL